MLAHPLHTVWMFMTQILKIDNFRNLGNAASANYLFVNLMVLNFGSQGVLEDKWYALFIPLLMITAVIGGRFQKRKSGMMVFGLLVLAGTVCLIWLAMYLSFMPVGTDAIYGVQARFYLPLLYAFVVLLNFHKRAKMFSGGRLQRVVYGVFCLLMGEMVYQYLLKNQLFPV